jgi:hypothetical protein
MRDDDLLLPHKKPDKILLLVLVSKNHAIRFSFPRHMLFTTTKIICIIFPVPYIFGVVSPVEEGKVCLLVAQEGMARVSLQLDRYPIHVQASPLGF